MVKEALTLLDRTFRIKMLTYIVRTRLMQNGKNVYFIYFYGALHISLSPPQRHRKFSSTETYLQRLAAHVYV